MAGHYRMFRHIALWLAITGCSGTLRYGWPLQDVLAHCAMAGHYRMFRHIALVATTGCSGTLRWWPLQDVPAHCAMAGHYRMFQHIALWLAITGCSGTLRHGWPLQDVPAHCAGGHYRMFRHIALVAITGCSGMLRWWSLQDVPACCGGGQAFSAAHAMCCAKGGFPTIRHNEVRDVLVDLLTEVCPDVAVEPLLAPVTNEVFVAASTNTNSDARADIRARDFWTRAQNAFFDIRVFHRAQNAFFDIRVFHPEANSYQETKIEKLLLSHESQKKLEYAERIVHVDRGTFTPLLFSTAGCAAPAPECQKFSKRLCEQL